MFIWTLLFWVRLLSWVSWLKIISNNYCIFSIYWMAILKISYEQTSNVIFSLCSITIYFPSYIFWNEQESFPYVTSYNHSTNYLPTSGATVTASKASLPDGPSCPTPGATDDGRDSSPWTGARTSRTSSSSRQDRLFVEDLDVFGGGQMIGTHLA